MERSTHKRLADAGWAYRTNADRGWIIYCDPATGRWHPEKEAVAIMERRTESQGPQRCDNPRVAPHLEMLADRSFASLIKIAQSLGIDVVEVPLDVMAKNVGNTWKTCIAEFLVALLHPASESAPQPTETSSVR